MIEAATAFPVEWTRGAKFRQVPQQMLGLMNGA
jgi:hypothetical protein